MITYQICTIRTPEGRFFQCRIATDLKLAEGEECLAELDYGNDIATLYHRRAHDVNFTERIPKFRVLRVPSAEDQKWLAESRELSAKAEHNFGLSAQHERGNVKIRHTRLSFGGERLFIRYSADEEVDLRRFVSQIQRDFKTQVDLRQLTTRDEAAIIGCLGACGRSACCCSWQRKIPPLGIRMAKEQGLAIKGEVLNGTCGQLKCCIQFEHQQYREVGVDLPDIGIKVRCREPSDTIGVVTGRDILRQLLTVRTNDGQFLTVALADITIVERERYYRKRTRKLR